MKREVILRINPPSPALERDLLAVLRREYTIADLIRQRVGNESYIYCNMESKDGNP